MPAKGIRERYEYLLKFLSELTPTDNCVEWPFAKASNGYGMVVMPDGRREVVHRIAFHFTHGRWPEPCTLHSCDNPPCFNPRHLSEGTDADNSTDARSKGRAHVLPPRLGTDHGCAILTEEQVREIRAAYIPRKVTYEALGKRYGVSMGTVFDIVKRRSWTHI
jgi:hypothetical protein